MLPPTLKRPAAIVTTSWDDGHVADLRLAELLHRYGFKGTFYVPFRGVREPLMNAPQIRELAGGGMEIGAHTVTHPSMKGLGFDRCAEEAAGGKARLEEIVGGEVPAFCYPNGDLDSAAYAAVRQAGFRLGRTTRNFRTTIGGDPWRMPVTLQYYPHDSYRRARIFGRNRDFWGLVRWATRFSRPATLDALVDALFHEAARRNGVFHLWGHSWELGEHNLWTPLERVLQRLARKPGVAYLTNTQALEAVQSS